MKKYLLTFLISMIPIIELRGAVPFGVAYNLPVWQAIIIGVIGNILPVPIIFFFARRVLELGADKPVIGSFFSWCLKKGHNGGQKLVKSAGTKGLYFALFLFVGIPLPGTGAWTGTLAASILDLKFKNSIIAVVSGVILAGFIMGFGSVFIKGLI
ncbi:COG2426 family protein [Streptococcus orisasini]